MTLPEKNVSTPLAGNIAALRDRTLSGLTAAHDYFANTKRAWSIARLAIARGQRLAVRNRVTGSWTTHQSLAKKSAGYVNLQLTEATFQQFVSLLEMYLVDLLRLWLIAHPKSLGGRKLDFETVLESRDKAAIVSAVVDKELHQLTYEKPTDWFFYLNAPVKLDRPTAAEIAAIAEAKATRDVLVHNRGIVNQTYLLKAGGNARYADGDRVEISQRYHRQTWELFRDVIDSTASAAIEKAT